LPKARLFVSHLEKLIGYSIPTPKHLEVRWIYRHENFSGKQTTMTLPIAEKQKNNITEPQLLLDHKAQDTKLIDQDEQESTTG